MQIRKFVINQIAGWILMFGFASTGAVLLATDQIVRDNNIQLRGKLSIPLFGLECWITANDMAPLAHDAMLIAAIFALLCAFGIVRFVQELEANEQKKIKKRGSRQKSRGGG